MTPVAVWGTDWRGQNGLRESSWEAIRIVQTRNGGGLDSYDGGGTDEERNRWTQDI